MSLSRKLAYTLVEILMTISIIGGLSGTGYVVMKNVNLSSSELKLDQDVRTINNAIRIYLTNGGKLPTDTSASNVVDKIRRQAMDLRKNAGLKSSTIDPRTKLGDFVTSGKRAVWDSESQRFEIVSTGTDRKSVV